MILGRPNQADGKTMSRRQDSTLKVVQNGHDTQVKMTF